MNKDDIELKFCKYKFAKFDLIIPDEDEPYSLDTAHVGNWTIEKDYENYYFPYFEVRCIVPDSIYSKVMESSENVYVDIRIEFAYFDDMTESDPAEMLYSYNKLLEDRFYAFIANRSPKLTDALLGEKNKDDENEEGTYSQYSYDNKKSLVMGLYRVDHIFKTNQIVNGVLSQCTAADAIVWVLNKLESNRVIMSPNFDSTKYDQLIIPPLTGPQTIVHIANNYGLYETGTIVFFDYDRIFVIDKSLTCNAYTSGEHNTVYLTSFPNSSAHWVMSSGYYENDDEGYLVVNIIGNSISITNQSMLNDQLVGGNIIAIDSNTGETESIYSDVTVSEEAMSQQGLYNRVVVIDEGSNLSLQGAKEVMEQSQKVMNITVENVNIQAFEPNKDFIFTTDNENYIEYQGHYRMTNMSAVFTKESEFYTVMCTASFVGGESAT